MSLIESLHKALLEFNITDKKEDVESILKKIGHEVEFVDHYISSGYWGDVFKVKGTNKVVKVTKDIEEYKVVKQLIDKEFNYVVNYFYATEYKRKHFLIVAEYLDSLDIEYDPNDRSLKGFFRSLSIGYYQSNGSSEKISEARTFLYRHLHREFEDHPHLANKYIKMVSKMGEQLPDKMYHSLLVELFMNYYEFIGSQHNERFRFLFNNVKLLSDIAKGLQELHTIDIVYEDAHLDNILLDPKTGNYKIIDIRFSG